MVSDRYGRRPVILISCLGLGLEYVFMAVAPSLTSLFIGHPDVTLEKDRARAFGLVVVALGLGFVVGPALGGVLASVEPRLPFWVTAAACLISAGFGWFALPESLPRERRTLVLGLL